MNLYYFIEFAACLFLQRCCVGKQRRQITDVTPRLCDYASAALKTLTTGVWCRMVNLCQRHNFTVVALNQILCFDLVELRFDPVQNIGVGNRPTQV